MVFLSMLLCACTEASQNQELPAATYMGGKDTIAGICEELKSAGASHVDTFREWTTDFADTAGKNAGLEDSWSDPGKMKADIGKIMEKIVLASGSPRRKELLARTGVVFSVVVSNGEEKTNLTDPAETVEKLSQDKAISVADRLENESEPCLIIGADTVVAFEGKILGKPSDEEDALDTLLKLHGKSHQVYTGVTLLVKEQGIWKPYTFSERTDVEFYPVSREELLEYIKTGEPMDKAGSYGIQGKFGIYVKGIHGDYNNVVGLPVGRLVYELKKMKINIRGMRK